MKKLIFLTMISVSVTTLSAQDLIITSFGDTIPCQIIKMDSISVTYQVVNKDGVKKLSMLARQFVTDYSIEQQNAANAAEIEETEGTPIVVNSAVMTGSKPVIISPVGVTRSKPEYTTFRWAFTSGYAKRLSKIPEIKRTNEDYIKLFEKLTNSFTWETEMQFYIDKRNAIALNVSGVHRSITKDGDVTIPDFGQFYNFKLNQRMIYVGPAWAKLFETEHFLFTSSLSAGVLIYTEKQWPHGSSVTTVTEKKHSVAGAINYGISGEYKMSSHSAIGIKIGTTLDSVSLFKIGNPNFKSQIPVSWSNLMFAAYLSFRN